MQYLWTYTRRMTPWTGKDSCRSWRSTLWNLGPAASFTHTGTGFRWWLERVEGGVLLGGIPRFQGVTQGGPLSPIILNVVVDAVVWHWISLVAGGAGGKDGWGREGIHRDVFFYVDDGLFASTEPV